MGAFFMERQARGRRAGTWGSTATDRCAIAGNAVASKGWQRAVQKLVGLWRALAPSSDLIGPDIYADDSQFCGDTMHVYHRPDNTLWIPETGRGDSFAKFFFDALGKAAIGFSPFGVDRSGWNILADEPWKAHARNFALIELTLSANERREGLKVEPSVCHYWNRRIIC
jgi:hypothetical protein